MRTDTKCRGCCEEDLLPVQTIHYDPVTREVVLPGAELAAALDNPPPAFFDISSVFAPADRYAWENAHDKTRLE